MINTDLPVILWFDDYHEIDTFGDTLKKIVKNVKWKELNKETYDLNGDEHYCGLFYLAGKEPNKSEYSKINSKNYKKKKKQPVMIKQSIDDETIIDSKNLKDLKTNIEKLIDSFGEDARLEFDAGYNNISVDVVYKKPKGK